MTTAARIPATMDSAVSPALMQIARADDGRQRHDQNRGEVEVAHSGGVAQRPNLALVHPPLLAGILAFAHIFRPKTELSPHLSPKNGRKLECFPHFDAYDFVWVRRFGKISRQVGPDAFHVAGFRPLVGGNLMKRVQI